MLRSFIAIEIPAEIQQAIAQKTAELRKSFPPPFVRWVAPQNIHLTLQFLGDVSVMNLEALSQTLAQEISTHSAMNVTVTGAGVFPSSRRPRVLWVGLDAPDGLTHIHHGIVKVIARMGYPVERRAFSPHLTIGRVKPEAENPALAKIYPQLLQANIAILGKFKLETIHIMKSDLYRSGPVYTRLFTLPLA